MKKSLLAILCASATLAYADLTVTETNQSAEGANQGNIVFTTDGAKLTAPKHIGATNIIVDSGVSATATTASGSAFYIGTAEEGSTISGAGKDVSELTFEGYIMGATQFNATAPKYALSIKDITFNMKRSVSGASNNLLRGGPISITNSNFNVLAGLNTSELQATITDSAYSANDNLTIANSVFTIQDGATLKMSNITGGTNSMVIDSSSFNVKGTLNFGSTGSGIILQNNSKFNVSETSTITTNSTMKVSSGSQFNVLENGKFETNKFIITINKGASSTIDGTLTLGKETSDHDSYINLDGTITINGYAYIGRKIRINGDNAKIILNSSNLTSDSGYHVHSNYEVAGEAAINVAVKQFNLEVNAQNKLNLCITKTPKEDKTITITLGDRGEADYLLAMDYLVANPNSTNFYATNELTSSTNGNIYYDFVSFTDGDVLFAKNTVTEDALKAALSHFKFNGKNIDWNYSSVEFNGVSYWAIAVPEPAEWAVIFGIVALAFTDYRRTKARRA